MNPPLGPRSWPSGWRALFVLLVLACACNRSATDRDRDGEGAVKKDEARSADAPTESMAESKESAESDQPAARGWKRSTIDTHRIRITVGDEQILPVTALAVAVHVDGFRARVVLDVDFQNPNDWTLEGDLSLRLPEGASPYFLAFGGHTHQAPPPPADPKDAASFTPAGIMAARAQVWTEAKQAVMVERDRAKVAYRNTVRRNVDPALSEWAGAGVFNTRLFPIGPNALHRVVIGYDVDLLEAADGWSLPVIVPEDAASRRLQIVVVPSKGVRATLERLDQLDQPGERFEPTKLDGQLQYVLDDPPAQLELALRGATNAALIGRDPATGDYFAARTLPQLPKSKARTGAGRAVFALDVSMSSNPEKFNVWLDLLKATLEHNRDELRSFALLFFNVEQFWYSPGFVDNTAEQLEALSQFADTLALEGATDLAAALREATRPSWLDDRALTDCDLFLLSDGFATWGEPDIEVVLRELRTSFAGRVFAYRTGLAETELSLLARLAGDSGGAVFAVTGPDMIAAAATAHRQIPWELRSISAAGVDDLLVAGSPRYLYPGQSLVLAGRIAPAQQGGDRRPSPRTLELVLSQAGQERTVKIELPPAIESETTPRIYGELAVGALERFDAIGKELGVGSLAYARHFRVTGRAASLLMLESDEDYARADIDLDEIAKLDLATIAGASALSRLELAEQTLGERLGDPRAAMLAILDRVAALSPTDGRPDPTQPLGALASKIRQLPDAALRVEIPRLDCQRHDRSVIDPKILAQLERRELVYDDLVAAAELRRTQVSPADGLKALSSLIEANPGNTVMARDVAFTARDWGLGAQVYPLLQRVAATRPEEPQTYLALGDLAAQLGAHDLALVYYEIALAGAWEQRFGDVEQIAAFEYLRMLGSTAPESFADPGFATRRRAELAELLPVRSADLLVIMTWNTDNTDIDLHVLEPSGEDCFYGNRSTKAGGQMSTDVTQGFGPEMYYIPKLESGDYRIRVHYFARDRNRLDVRTKVHVTVFRSFGRPNQQIESKIVTLEQDEDTHSIMTVRGR